MRKTEALDTIHMQIMWNRLISVVEEQAQALLRTAFSPIVRECGDLSAGGQPVSAGYKHRRGNLFDPAAGGKF